MKTIAIKKRITDDVLFSYEVANNDRRPMRTALMAAIRAGRSPDDLRIELAEVESQLASNRNLTKDERDLRERLVAVINSEIAAPRAGAYLADANLAGARLAGANLAGAYLAGARNIDPNTPRTEPPEPYKRPTTEAEHEQFRIEHMQRYRARHPDVPVVENLDTRILRAVHEENMQLEMGSWHGGEPENGTVCGMTHCRGGFAIHFAGKAGYELERKYGVQNAAAMIYRASCGYVPHFFATNERALEDLKLRAEREQAIASAAQPTT